MVRPIPSNVSENKFLELEKKDTEPPLISILTLISHVHSGGENDLDLHRTLDFRP